MSAVFATRSTGSVISSNKVCAAESRPLAELPPGVNGYVGWANRLLFASSSLWVVLVSLAVIRR